MASVGALTTVLCVKEALHGGFTDHLLVRRSQTRELH